MITIFIGGMLIGVAVSVLFLFSGRIAGNSGILGGLFTAQKDKQPWRFYYAVGLVLGAVVFRLVFQPDPLPQTLTKIQFLIMAGLLVGFGTQLGSGCTSGHGICGFSRFSRRSITAMVMFMLTGMATVWIAKHSGVYFP